jgi:hypothetical protein
VHNLEVAEEVVVVEHGLRSHLFVVHLELAKEFKEVVSSSLLGIQHLLLVGLLLLFFLLLFLDTLLSPK